MSLVCFFVFVNGVSSYSLNCLRIHLLKPTVGREALTEMLLCIDWGQYTPYEILLVCILESHKGNVSLRMTSFPELVSLAAVSPDLSSLWLQCRWRFRMWGWNFRTSQYSWWYLSLRQPWDPMLVQFCQNSNKKNNHVVLTGGKTLLQSQDHQQQPHVQSSRRDVIWCWCSTTSEEVT